MSEEQKRAGIGTLVTRLLVGVVAMFGFGFALVPLYDVICDVTGLNGNTSNLRESAEVAETSVESGRQVTMQFIANPHPGDNWRFEPSDAELVLNPGDVHRIHYTVTNPLDHPVVTQAIPSVSPSAASQYLKKIECFCFQEQTLAAGETVEMPLRFYVDPELPERVGKLTLSYTLYDRTRGSEVASN